jgi:hypothetical protein
MIIYDMSLFGIGLVIWGTTNNMLHIFDSSLLDCALPLCSD